jgi:hypothetical protein
MYVCPDDTVTLQGTCRTASPRIGQRRCAVRPSSPFRAREVAVMMLPWRIFPVIEVPLLSAQECRRFHEGQGNVGLVLPWMFSSPTASFAITPHPRNLEVAVPSRLLGDGPHSRYGYTTSCSSPSGSTTSLSPRQWQQVHLLCPSCGSPQQLPELLAAVPRTAST